MLNFLNFLLLLGFMIVGLVRLMADAMEGNPPPKLCTRMRVWELPEEYVVEPIDGSCSSFLVISRRDGSMKLAEELPQIDSSKAPKISTAFGVMGVLTPLSGSFVVMITDRECVGTYLGHPIYKILSMQILPCNLSVSRSSSDQKKIEAELSMLLRTAERFPGLYFSYDTNLTLSAQRLNRLGDESKLLPLWRQAEPRFLWNNYMLEVLIENKLDPYLLPVIQGSFHHFQTSLGKGTIDVTLIARRCMRRTGTRMWRRGADSDGYVANFVETEQILYANGYTLSFVQVRGSIPILWEQVVNLKYKPPFKIIRPNEATQVAERHFLDLRKRYDSVLVVDLVNKCGGEGQLNDSYQNAIQSLLDDGIRYVHFDFHQICGHMHFDRLSVLYDQIADYLKQSGYFMLDPKGDRIKVQLGVVRSNCIDCLDRTNVTQSMIGRKILENQLQQIGFFSPDEFINLHPKLDQCFKEMWANHGDDISMQYAGTPALKRDLVRYGKQTIPGVLMDGWSALTRYYLNNFCDGTRQDAIDLVLGHYMVSVSRGGNPLPQGRGLEAFVSIRLALTILLAGFYLTFLSLRQARGDLRHFLLSLLWAGLSLSLAAYIRNNGRMFCNRPRLNKF